MKVLVTGGSGLLATHIIEQLLKRGYQVRATIRNKSKFRLYDDERIDLLEGDILDFNFMLQACEDCDFVIHAAAQTPCKAIDERIYHQVNVTGTANTLRAAVKQNCRRFIFVSTANTIGYGTSGTPGNEMHGMKAPFTSLAYATTKLRAEELVLSYREKMDVIIVNPTFLLGQHIDEAGSGQLLHRAFKKRIVFYPSGSKNIVHVQDVANATINSLTHGRSGERYLLSGESISFRDFYRLAATENKEMAHVQIPIPSIILLLTGITGSALNFIGLKTKVNYSNVCALLIDGHYTNEKAISELKASFRPAHATIRETVQWLLKHNN